MLEFNCKLYLVRVYKLYLSQQFKVGSSNSSCGAHACKGPVKQEGEHPPAEGQDSKVLEHG
jgi:hypothetical protein